MPGLSRTGAWPLKDRRLASVDWDCLLLLSMTTVLHQRLVHGLHGKVGDRFKEHKHTMQAVQAQAKRHNADTLVMVPKDGTTEHAPLSMTEHAVLKVHGFSIHTVDWVTPPAMHSSFPTEGECGETGYMEVHALAMDKYSVVILIDIDMVVLSELNDIINCANQDRFLSTTGVASPISQSMFALKPKKGLFNAALGLAKSLPLTPHGPTGTIWGDETGDIPRTDCAAGLFWALFYSQRYAEAAKNAMQTNGVLLSNDPKKPWRPKAFSVDRCTWGRSTDDLMCKNGNVTCASVKIAHADACRL
jgi:hypothetical protein